MPADFSVDSNGILSPLGLIVLRDSRRELLPRIEHFSEEVPGRHGELSFGYRFGGRILELHVVTNEGFSLSQREQVKRDLAKYLNPLSGPKTLVFADDADKTYYVKYAGNIDLNQYPSWLEFTIPFKLSRPFVIQTSEQTLTGSGTIINSGNLLTFLRIEITGPVTNPSVIVGGQTLTYTGVVSAGQTLVIDTEKSTVELDGANALDTYSGGYPKLQPGDTVVTAASAGLTTWLWRSRWIF